MNNGFVSAAISFLRTFLFQVAAVCFLPLIIGIDGVWTSVLAAGNDGFGGDNYIFNKGEEKVPLLKV